MLNILTDVLYNDNNQNKFKFKQFLYTYENLILLI